MKPFWRSKTLWVNAIAFAGILYQQVSDNDVLLQPSVQAEALAFVNVALRLITNQGLDLGS